MSLDWGFEPTPNSVAQQNHWCLSVKCSDEMSFLPVCLSVYSHSCQIFSMLIGPNAPFFHKYYILTTLTSTNTLFCHTKWRKCNICHKYQIFATLETQMQYLAKNATFLPHLLTTRAIFFGQIPHYCHNYQRKCHVYPTLIGTYNK